MVYGHPSHCGNPYAGYNIKISKQIPIDGFMTIPDYTPGRYKDISNMKHTHIYINIEESQQDHSSLSPPLQEGAFGTNLGQGFVHLEVGQVWYFKLWWN